MRFHQIIQNSSCYFYRLKRVCHIQTLTSTEHHISSLHSHLWVQLSTGSAFPKPNKNGKFLRLFIISMYGLAGTHCYIHQYKLPVNFFTNPTSGGSAEVNFWGPPKTVISCDKFIRECGSTLYVGLACTAPPTNINFRLTFILTRLQEALYEDLPL